MLPISYFHYNKLKKQNADKPNMEDDDFEDIL
jgi:CDP-diacylglycerol--serine O-phosphatidyltransferase